MFQKIKTDDHVAYIPLVDSSQMANLVVAIMKQNEKILDQNQQMLTLLMQMEPLELTEVERPKKHGVKWPKGHEQKV